MIKGQLEVDGKVYNIIEYNWFGLIRMINDMMKDQEIQFPLGEDDATKMVTKKVKETDKYSG